MTLRRWLRQAVVLLVTCALAVLHTWPLAQVWRTHLLGGRFEDPWMNLWHIDWMRRSVLTGQSPFFAPMLHHPLGAELYWHTLAPAKTVPGALLIPLLGPVGSLNAVVAGTFVLTGMTTFWLCADRLRRAGLTGPRADAAALLGACVFDFSRYHLCHAVAHVNLAAVEGLPLFVLAFLRWVEGGARRWAWAAALSAGYVAFCDFYYVYYLALFATFWMVGRVWSSAGEGRIFSRQLLARPDVRRALLLAGAASVAVLPAVLPLLWHLHPAPISYHHGDSDYPADLLSPLLPDRLSMWNAFLPEPARRAANLMQRGILNDIEGGCFWGLCAPLLAMLAWRRRAATRSATPDDARLYLGLLVAFWVLSLGVHLNIGGFEPQPAAVGILVVGLLLFLLPVLRATRWGRDVRIFVAALMLAAPFLSITAHGQPALLRIPLPYLLFKHLVPLFGRGGMPVRFLLPSQLCLAVLATFGAAHALGWLAARRRAPRLVAAAGAVALLAGITLETKSAALPTTYVPQRAQIFDPIRLDPEPGVAVFTDHVIGQWEETLHHKPVSYARQSRLPVREQVFQQSALARMLIDVRHIPDEVDDALLAQLRDELSWGHYKYFVAHTAALTVEDDHRELAPLRRRLVMERMGGVPVYEDPDVQIYRFW